MWVLDIVKDIYSDLDIIVRSLFRSIQGEKRDSRCADIWRHGFLMQKDVVSVSGCRRLKDEIDILLSDPSVKIWQDSLKSDNRIYGLDSVTDKVDQNIDIPAIKSLGEQYLGKKIVDYFVLGARLQAKSGSRGSGGGWHRDSPFSHQFKAIIYLNNVQETSGPFEYIVGSHKSLNKWQYFSVKRLAQTRYGDSEIDYNAKHEIETFVAPLGSAIFVDTRGAHRGKPIQSGNRYAITFYFYTNPIPEHVKSQLQEPK